ncbi:MAG: VWA domain-containing protein [Deltaproteobacteria bacterium]|jgi:uncharacterized protein YegL|nr:VWA domain-containing protein [Deltaproteobacteria bacterium]
MRRLPIYIIIDTSGSMRGEPIESVKTGLKALLSGLRRDPHASETAHLSIITFDLEARVLFPLTALEDVKIPEIPVPKSSPTNLGAALELLLERYRLEVRTSSSTVKGDWMPVAVVMTDGSPSDTLLFEETCEKVRAQRFARVIGCAAGPKAKTEPLGGFATDVVTLENLDSSGFSKFFQWVSQSFSRHSLNAGRSQEALPPPPSEIKFAV